MFSRVVVVFLSMFFMVATLGHAAYMPTDEQLAAMDKLLETHLAQATCAPVCTPWISTPGAPLETEHGKVAYFSRVGDDPMWRLKEWVCDEQADVCTMFLIDFGEKGAISNIVVYQKSTMLPLGTMMTNHYMAPTDPGAVTSSEIVWELLMRLGVPL